MRDDALYHFSPRWLEESGLPEALNRAMGPGGWLVFKKLTELEIEQNLLPDTFVTSRTDLAEWTGLAEDEVESILQKLEEEGLIQRKKATAKADTLRLKFPRSLPVPRNREEIAQRLQDRGWQIESIHWRYLAPARLRQNEQKVLHLYHQMFGARMNDRIAADLVAIAHGFEYAEVEKIFDEAKRGGHKSMGWILGRLYQGVGDEGIQKTRRRAQRKKSTRRTQTDG